MTAHILKIVATICLVNILPLAIWLSRMQPAPELIESDGSVHTVRVSVPLGKRVPEVTKLLFRATEPIARVDVGARSLEVKTDGKASTSAGYNYPPAGGQQSSCFLLEDYVACAVHSLAVERKGLWRTFDISVETRGEVVHVRAVSFERDTVPGADFFGLFFWNVLMVPLGLFLFGLFPSSIAGRDRSNGGRGAIP